MSKMLSERKVSRVLHARPTMEGAGVYLHRAFGSESMARLMDPFLLLDDFRSSALEQSRAGFPSHPHRGIQTVTYMLSGSVEHKDSMGSEGVVSGPAGAQWMSAGSGIVHSEMPKGTENDLPGGFQLWVNLPRKDKMMPPLYNEVREIPLVVLENGTSMRVISGAIGEISGPITGIVNEPIYADITIPKNTSETVKIPSDCNLIVYVIDGTIRTKSEDGEEGEEGNRSLLLYGPGELITLSSGPHTTSSSRVLFIAGKRLNESVAWAGPIVMNTKEELDVAFTEYRNGSFLKHKGVHIMK